MIQILASRYQKRVAILLFSLFYASLVTPSLANYFKPEKFSIRSYRYNPSYKGPNHFLNHLNPSYMGKMPLKTLKKAKVHKTSIGGPNQPEMSSFKPAGIENMVNLFTGDFSYNIPLLDVGGYPVNIFYNGGITMEQEPSWVGLGWNINPGTISRNVRGIPDDFNGEEQLEEYKDMKPNKTWGASFGGDFELFGTQVLDQHYSLGFSYNNYLGPALEITARGNVAFQINSKTTTEKSAQPAGSIKLGYSASLSSRYGFTFSPSASLSANSFISDGNVLGTKLSTSYNARTGIKELQISEQMSFNNENVLSNLYNNDYSISSSISFAKPSYIPTLRAPIESDYVKGHFKLGAGFAGSYPAMDVEAFSEVSTIKPNKQSKPMVGYMYYQNGQNDPNAVMDFTRLNDREVTPVTTIISAPQYTYDVFSIQGEGTGGTIRAFRNDLSYVKDNYTRSKSNSTTVGLDVGPPGHYGVNADIVKSPSSIGEWQDGNKLKNATKFSSSSVQLNENLYFKNPGESSVLSDGQFDRIGGVDLVRFKMSGDGMNPSIEPVLERFDKNKNYINDIDITRTHDKTDRKKRSQVISFLTAEEAFTKDVGLDQYILNYDPVHILSDNNTLNFQKLPRIDLNPNDLTKPLRRPHHISQINVTESNGKRYVYGLPVYNIEQTDYSFSVNGGPDPALNQYPDAFPDDVPIDPNNKEMETTSNWLQASSTKRLDGYYQKTCTPPYAHSFLLTGLLSPDYVDVTGDGITEDDLGDAVKFNYTKVDNHKWRTPYYQYVAHFNAGNHTETKDDKGMVTYGERESWYMHSIESKTMIALFTLADRRDGKSVSDENGGIKVDDHSSKLLKQIDLYSKADLKMNGLAGAHPIKTIHFEYNYKLCKNVPDNDGLPVDKDGNTVDVNATGNVNKNKGKLTLAKIYFTFNGQKKASPYIFGYNEDNDLDNPVYKSYSSDRWGNYKSDALKKPHMKNSDFPYCSQYDVAAGHNFQTEKDAASSAWSLKKILLPAGAEMDINYESDDYAFVQNRRAEDMMPIVGLGKTETQYSQNLYDFFGNGQYDYVFIKIPEAYNKDDFYKKYLDGNEQFCFKLNVNMPNGNEMVTCFASLADPAKDPLHRPNYGNYEGDNSNKTIWLRLEEVDNLSPLNVTVIEYLREQLPGQAYPGYQVTDGSGLEQAATILIDMFANLAGAFSDPANFIRSKGFAHSFEASTSFARLNNPYGKKYGGGHRVQSITLYDNWDKMSGKYVSSYGHQYTYKTTEDVNGNSREISSGVASYEPSIGGEENPFHTVRHVDNSLPLGPTNYGAIEMPFLDAFFPAPTVGYSKVTVTSIHKGQQANYRSGIGKQVTEYYTAKDFPVYYSNTEMDGTSNLEAHIPTTGFFLYQYSADKKAISQGFLVETNDMHGKLKSQASYSETDDKTPINYTENFYSNTGSNGLNEKFKFAFNAQGGTVMNGNMGIDVELMTDTREFATSSRSREYQIQGDMIPLPLPWIATIWPITSEAENTYRAITTTKLVNYHSILTKVLVIDKGSQVTTNNLVYDSETGEVVVNQTTNEFDKPVYHVSYPAYWAYSGMGPAYKNIDGVFTNVYFKDGVIQNLDQTILKSTFESGDEVYIFPGAFIPALCDPDNHKNAIGPILWAFDINKNDNALTPTNPSFVFMDKEGNPFNATSASFRIIRSGKRNMLGASVATVITMQNPVTQDANPKLSISSNSVVNATAVEYFEKWQADNTTIQKMRFVHDPVSCIDTEVPDCNGYLEKRINPYVKGLLGNFRLKRNLVYYGDRKTSMGLQNSGLLDNYSPYWHFDVNNNLVSDLVVLIYPLFPNPTIKWTWNSMLNRTNARGLELETMNLLGIYTSAQYGYYKTLPIAITNNAQYAEMGYEGFEDNDYKNSINSATILDCANNHHMEFDNGSIVKTDGLSFSAHTGKYVMGIPTSGSSKTFPVTHSSNLNYDLNLGSGQGSVLNDPGGNFSFISYTGNYIGDNTVDIYNSSDVDITIHPGSEHLTTKYHFDWDTYLEIPVSGTYQFEMGVSSNYNLPDGTTYTLTMKHDVIIMDLNGNTYWQKSVTSTANGSVYTDPTEPGVFLCKGIYHIVGSADQFFNTTYASFGNNVYNWRCKNYNGTLYKSTQTQVNCTYATAIAGIDAMINPEFSFPAGKKMLFSAWVHEDCNDQNNGTPCSQVQIQYSDGTTSLPINASGPKIEGWRKIEGIFTPPNGATTATINFINNAGHTIYIDDIRIHPFNANMKSYVYDPVNLRLVAELDANNYASLYEYDEEGTLIRTKAETKDGVKTIKETRSGMQKTISTFR